MEDNELETPCGIIVQDGFIAMYLLSHVCAQMATTHHYNTIFPGGSIVDFTLASQIERAPPSG